MASRDAMQKDIDEWKEFARSEKARADEECKRANELQARVGELEADLAKMTAQLATQSSGERPEDLKARMQSQDAAYWGLTMSSLSAFRHEIDDDLLHYAASHDMAELEGDNLHVCRDGCPFRDLDNHLGTLPMCIEDRSDIADGVELVPLPADMHLVVLRYIKPQTKEANTSYSMMKHGPQRVNTFVSHSWSEIFLDLVDTLEMALSSQEAVFLSSFTLNQNADVVDSLIGTVSQTPFAVALKAADKIVVTIDAGISVPTRLWCCFELYLALAWRKPILVYWPPSKSDIRRHIEPQIEDLDAGDAVATWDEDGIKIRKVMAMSSEVEKLNHHLRNLLLDRTKLFKKVLNMSPAAGFSEDLPNRLRELEAEVVRKTSSGTQNEVAHHLSSDVKGILFEPPMVWSSYDAELQRDVYHVAALCWLKCYGILSLPTGHWQVGLLIRVDEDLYFDTELVLAVNGKETRTVSRSFLHTAAVNEWLFLEVDRISVCPFSILDVEVSLMGADTADRKNATPKSGLSIGGVKAILQAEYFDNISF